MCEEILEIGKMMGLATDRKRGFSRRKFL